MSRRSFPGRAATALLFSGALACSALRSTPPQTSDAVEVRVNGVAEPIDPGTTLAELVRRDQLRPAPGHVITVSGRTMHGHVYPGRILLNGAEATRSTALVSGDRIRVIDGADRTEPTVRTTRMVGWQLGDPEFSLAMHRTREITVRGKISHEVVSVTDQPIGPGKAPKAVALTFDDGTWPDATARIVEVLQRFDVPATFFEIGRQIAQQPRVVRMIASAG